MKKFLQQSPKIIYHNPLVVICTGVIVLTGCSSGSTSTATSPPPETPTKTATPPPIYSSEHIKKNLIPPEEVAKNLRKVEVAFQGAKEGKATSCSLSKVELPGDPETIARQLVRNNHPSTEIHYIQFIARYKDPQEAGAAFQKVQNKALSCPPKQNVPPKRTSRGTTMLPHKDTWKTEEGIVAGWRHLRGHERRTFPRSMTRYNISFMVYDYAVRGNVLVCTYYSERQNPGESSTPITKRATEILTRQLQKLDSQIP